MQSENIKEQIVNSKKIISNFINHKHIFLKSRGNKAILDSFKFVKDNSNKNTILVPNQGGWLTYLDYPKKCNLEVKQINTDYGVINLDELKIESKNVSALIYQNPAGYIANQDIKKIYEICKENNCLVILDVTGSISDERLCDGKYADIIVCSFGNTKIVNLGYGGFISFLNKPEFEIIEDFDEEQINNLINKLNDGKSRLNELYNLRENTLIELEKQDLKIVHKDKIGINIVVLFKDELEKEKIINFCNKNQLEYTLCPKYIRVLDNAISIEIKRK
jgi:hypothetical protein